MDGVPFLFNHSFPEARSQQNITPTVRTVGVLYTYLEQGLLLTLVLVLAVQSAQRLG